MRLIRGASQLVTLIKGHHLGGSEPCVSRQEEAVAVWFRRREGTRTGLVDISKTNAIFSQYRRSAGSAKLSFLILHLDELVVIIATGR